MFTTPIGTVINPGNLRYAWWPITEVAGIKGAVPRPQAHLRDAALNLRVPPHIVRDIAGHSATEVTMTIYAHTSMDEKRDALGKLDEHLTDNHAVEKKRDGDQDEPDGNEDAA